MNFNYSTHEHKTMEFRATACMKRNERLIRVKKKDPITKTTVLQDLHTHSNKPSEIQLK